jgi:NAD(P)-dependent dehydrogenase (short-subunit alcohol dehydrogenase family)
MGDWVTEQAGHGGWTNKPINPRAVFLETDVADREQLEGRLDQVAAELGNIDILVNNAKPSGEGQPVRLEYTTAERIE